MPRHPYILGGRVCTQVARMGADADTLEEFWMKYGHPELLNCESLFRFFGLSTPHLQRAVLWCLAPKGVRRLLSGGVLPVFTNT